MKRYVSMRPWSASFLVVDGFLSGYFFAYGMGVWTMGTLLVGLAIYVHRGLK